MRRAATSLALLLLCSSLTAESTAVTLRGRIFTDDQPLPGATVQLMELDSILVEVVSDSDGRFTIPDAPRGYFEIKASLEGLEHAVREIYVDDTDLVVEPMSLRLAVTTETITFTCGSPCGGESQPTCDDYNRNRELESAAATNPVALDELRARYRVTSSREELARIGGLLISILEDDGEYIRPLMESTELLLSFAETSDASLDETTPQYVAWCTSTGRHPGNELWLLYSEAEALLSSTDSRAITYAHRGLRVRDFGLRLYAIGLASLTCDASLLKAINDDFDSLAEDGGKYSLVELFPCEDPALNERIMAFDDLAIEAVLPEITANRNEALARVRRPAR